MSDKPGNKTDAWHDDESSVSRAYGKLHKAEPPAHLSEHILAEARRAAAAQDSTVIRVQRWRKWTMPAALAATMVFAVPLVVRVFTNLPGDLNAPGALRETTKAESEFADTATPPQRSGVPVAVEIAPQVVADDKNDEQAYSSLQRHTPEKAPALSPASQIERAMEADVAEQRQSVPTAPEPSVAKAMHDPADEESHLDHDERVVEQPVDAQFVAEVEEFRTNETAGFAQEAPESPVAGAAPEVSPMALEVERVDIQSTAERIEEFDDTSMAAEADVDDASMAMTNAEAAEDWLVDIARMHQRGRVMTARRQLGSFLTEYPDYELPEYYPLKAGDAIFAKSSGEETHEIVPEAESWLRGIGLMVERGEIDQARIQLADFFKIYPNYPLPVDFPLTRDDAAPIDR